MTDSLLFEKIVQFIAKYKNGQFYVSVLVLLSYKISCPLATCVMFVVYFIVIMIMKLIELSTSTYERTHRGRNIKNASHRDERWQ